MINIKTLSEKLKYLIGEESNRQFEILDLDVDFYDGNSGYQLFIKFDYFGVINSQMPGFAADISKMIEKIEKIVSKVTVTPERNYLYLRKLRSNLLSTKLSIRLKIHIFLLFLF
jgi:hypothetical protein